MTIQTINIGNVVNDGLGDDLRTAFQKVNANFATLNSSLTITAINLGTTGSNVFKQKTGTNLEFRKLVSGTKIALDEQAETITINNTAPHAFFRFDTNSGYVTAGSGNSNGQITIQGGDDIDVTSNGTNTITVNNVIPVTQILTTYDFGFISGDFTNTTQLALAAANIEFGTITLPSTLNLDCGGII